VCLGAILTQNTAWSNVEKALSALRSRGLVAFEPLSRVPPRRLASLLRSSGTYNVKARRVGAFLRFLGAESAAAWRR
jgi:endonuclease-3 related protein